jgi:hypothetical protein
LLAYIPSGAADDNRVALVVDFGNGEVATRCVSFPEEQITGHEALVRSGLPVETDYQAGGAAVCRIDGTGCPAADCFCSCRGGGDNCVYWSYWHLTGDAWQYAPGGSGQYQVRDGAVDGWVWGLGSVTQAEPPPLVSFGDVCTDAPPATATHTSTPTITPTPIIIQTTAPVPDIPTSPTPTTLTVTAALSTTTVTSPATGSPAATGDSDSVGTVLLPTRSTPAPTATRPAATLSSPTPAAQPPDPTAAPQVPDSTLPPAVDAVSAIAPTAGADALPTAPLPTEPFGGFTDDPAAVAALSESATGTAAAITPSPTAPAVAAVIGAQSPPTGRTAATSAKATATTETAEPSNPLSYAGFAGLVLLLGALALLAYRRRGGMGRES